MSVAAVPLPGLSFVVTLLPDEFLRSVLWEEPQGATSHAHSPKRLNIDKVIVGTIPIANIGLIHHIMKTLQRFSHHTVSRRFFTGHSKTR